MTDDIGNWIAAGIIALCAVAVLLAMTLEEP